MFSFCKLLYIFICFFCSYSFSRNSCENQLNELRVVGEAEKVLGIRLSPLQRKAVEIAHVVGAGEKGKDGTFAGVGNYTAIQLRRKSKILKTAEFSKNQRRKLISAGVVGVKDKDFENDQGPLSLEQLLSEARKDERVKVPSIYSSENFIPDSSEKPSRSQRIEDDQLRSGLFSQARNRERKKNLEMYQRRFFDPSKKPVHSQRVEDDQSRSGLFSQARNRERKKHLEMYKGRFVDPSKKSKHSQGSTSIEEERGGIGTISLF